MKSKVIRPGATVVALQLTIGIAVAGAFDDDLMKLQQEQFRLQRQLMKEQFNQQRQFYEPQSRWQWSTVPTRIDSFPTTANQPSLWGAPFQSSLQWRSLEAAGLTRPSDYVAMLGRSMSLIREGVSRPGLGPDTVVAPNGQLVWASQPVATMPHEFFRGVTLGLHFGVAFTRDWEMVEQGTWSFPTSYAFEASVTEGLSRLGSWVDIRAQALGSELSPLARHGSRLMYGLPEAATGVFSQIRRQSLTPNIDEITNYIDAGGMTVAGYASSLSGLGSTGATLFKAAASLGRLATYPMFESWAMAGVRRDVLHNYEILRNNWEAAGLPVQSLAQFYGPEYLRGIGFGPDITGLPRPNQRSNWLGMQETTFTQIASTPLNQVSYLGNTRIEQTGFMHETRIISTPTNVFDRWLVQTGFLTPDSVFDFNSGSTAYTRQWSITTTTISTPDLGMTSQWSTPQTTWNSSTIPQSGYSALGYYLGQQTLNQSQQAWLNQQQWQNQSQRQWDQFLRDQSRMQSDMFDQMRNLNDPFRNNW